MKSKSAIIIFFLVLFLAPVAYAETPVVGEVYGQIISSMSMADSGLSYGVTVDDLNTPGEECDNDAQLCRLGGFSWSDRVGWTSWDGSTLQTDLGVAQFPNEYVAKISYRGSLSGYIWGEKYGWIQLSACAGITNGAACSAKSYCSWVVSDGKCEVNKNEEIPNVQDQTVDDWGVYIDFCPLRDNQLDCEAPELDQYCNWDSVDKVCVLDGPANPYGHPFRGYAWSEYLGWIKFGPEFGELDFQGAFTKWYPDVTPPKFEIFDFDAVLNGDAWIPNQTPFGFISWPEFADENESFIDLINSKIMVETDHTVGVFDGCPDPVAAPHGNVLMTQGGFGNVDLSIPQIGYINAPPYGFCKYTLSGVIYNGSGFGYYFGPVGHDIGENTDSLNFENTDDPPSYAPNIYDPKAVTLYVRAGDPVYNLSSLAFTAGGLVADGNNLIDLTFGPKDAGQNPIIPVRTNLNGNLPIVDPSLWVRDVKLKYDFNQTNDYAFDALSYTRNLDYPSPAIIENEYLAFSDPLQSSPVATPSSGRYSLSTRGLAPTLGTNLLNLDAIALTTVDAELPALSQSLPVRPAATKDTTFNGSNPPGIGEPLSHAYSFTPALEVTDGNLNADFIVLGQTVEANFTYKNNSPDSLTAYSLDNLLTFDDTAGIGEEVLEMNNINLIGSPDADETPGRTDPDLQSTRYQLLHDSRTLTLPDVNLLPDVNEFHNASQNYHPISNFYTSTDPNGVYKVEGSYYVSPDDECLTTTPPSCPEVNLDRSDTFPDDLLPGSSSTFAFSFLPSQYIGEAVGTQVTFGIGQYIAYHSEKNPYSQFAIFPATPYIDGVEVKALGLGTSGIVGGQQIYESVSGRDLETISTTSSADLRRDIRKNVASLTRTLTPCTFATTPIITLSELPADTATATCVAKDETNKTIIAYYQGPGTLQIGDGSTISVPSGYKYTLILTNGANLYLTDNIVYNAADNSFGMIVMQNEEGQGGNVYINPAPTNFVGLLYAEGSILSTPDGGASFYYGAGANSDELKNQLFWQGSIASRNTIGGAPNKVVPDGVDCDRWDNVINCAQAYDLDYVRRFATLNKGSGIYAPAGYLFSGGGSCVAALPTAPDCSHGTLGVTLSTISIDSGFILPTPASKSLNTFFIERDNRPVPPGFSSGGGLTSTSEIR